MKPPKPLPTVPPFLSIYTPTFRRPMGLVKCIESVARQTARDDIEQVILPDHVGYGVAGGLWGRMPRVAPALHGRYIATVCDDDRLYADDVVEKLRAFATKHDDPDVIVARVIKAALDLPSCQIGRGGPPELAEVDLCNFIVRRDVWLAHVGDYGSRYEGDFDHALAMWNAGRRFEYCDVLWLEGGLSNGRPEVDWP